VTEEQDVSNNNAGAVGPEFRFAHNIVRVMVIRNTQSSVPPATGRTAPAPAEEDIR
jgi:hypothetical protein